MKRLLLFKSVLTIFILILFSGCSTKTTGLKEQIDFPQWFSTPPVDKNIVYGVATASSKDPQLALEKAIIDARAEIAKQIKVHVQGIQKSFDEEIGVGTDRQLFQMYTQVTKTVVSMSLNGSKIKEQSLKKNGDTYWAIVLVEYPVMAANEELVNQLKSNEEYSKFRASQTFEELERELKDMMTRKNDNTNNVEGHAD